MTTTKKISFVFVLISLGWIVFQSCQKSPELNDSITNEAHIRGLKHIEESAEQYLGRVLFYDQTLSTNRSISCGSCHLQSLAFSDFRQFSSGFERVNGDRNAPAIQNLANSRVFFWDGRHSQLDSMVLDPIFNHVEMGIRSDEELLQNIRSKEYYSELYLSAFQQSEITIEGTRKALTAFIAGLQSNQSKFDQLGFFGLSQSQQRGMELFFGKYNCGNCHNLLNPQGYSDGLIVPSQDDRLPFPSSTGPRMANIGLDVYSQDPGKQAVTSSDEDRGKFKIPNLRNVLLTAPYMHDGRFKTLDEVFDHYAHGVNDNPNLDDRLKDEDGRVNAFEISKVDRDHIIDFLASLTDNEFLTNPKFSDPFKHP